MADPRFTLEGNPDLYVTEALAEQALNIGVTTLQADRANVDLATRLALGNETGITRLGAVLLAPGRHLKHLVGKPPARVLHVPEGVSLQDALNSPDTHGHHDLLAAALQQGVNVLAARVSQPTTDKLTSSVYWAANNWTNRWPSGETNPGGISSRLDRWVGAASGTVLLGLADAADWPIDIGLEIEGTSLPVVGGAFTGLAAGRVALSPLFALLRKRVSSSRLVNNPPIQAGHTEQG